MEKNIWRSLVIALTFLMSIPVVAKAADTVPEGINLESVFDASFTKFEDGQKNTANVPANSPNMVEITNGQKQVGAIWSNEQHKFKLHEEKHVSMWIYFEKVGRTAGDGIAFVLHNDPSKTRAIAKDVSKNNGQSLGVWGNNIHKENSSQAVAKNAIQNSWALEFDTYRNDQLVSGSGLDFGVPQKSSSHVYAGFPGKASTYLLNPKSKVTTYQLKNNKQAQPIFDMVDSGWHHLSLDWFPPVDNSNQGTMHYKFNDKIYNKAGHKSPSIAENYVQIDLDETFGANVDEVYWGFTGSTGNNAERARVVFESVPDLVRLKSSQQVINLTTQQELKSTTDGLIPASNHVNANDELEYTFTGEHAGGQIWKIVRLTLPSIDNLIVSKVEMYQYQNGSENPVHKQSWNSLPNNQVLIQKPVEKGGRIVVKVTGKVKTITPANKQARVVQKEPVIFNAPNGKIEFDIPPVALIDNKYYTYGFSPNQKVYATNSIDEEDDIVVQTTITHPSSVDAHEFNQIVMMNGDNQEIGRLKMATQNVPEKDGLYFSMRDDHNPGLKNSKLLEFRIPYEKYHEKLSNLFRFGKHHLAFYVVDKKNNQVSNYIYLDLNIRGQLKLEVSPTMTFQSITLNGQDRELVPNEYSGWYLKVLNHSNQDWALEATASKLELQGSSRDVEAAGELVFHGLGNSNPPIIARSTDVKMNENLEYDIGKQLKERLKLKLYGSARAGEYGAKITWTLKLTPA